MLQSYSTAIPTMYEHNIKLGWFVLLSFFLTLVQKQGYGKCMFGVWNKTFRPDR
jgi:hypothetical protein